MTNPKALKDLYVALGGTAADVENLDTSVEVLNAISVLLGGEDGALVNPKAIENIAEVASGAGGGSSISQIDISGNGFSSGHRLIGAFCFAVNRGGYNAIELGSSDDYGHVPVYLNGNDVELPYLPLDYRDHTTFVTPNYKGNEGEIFLAFYLNNADVSVKINNEVVEPIVLGVGSGVKNGYIITGDCSIVINAG